MHLFFVVMHLLIAYAVDLIEQTRLDFFNGIPNASLTFNSIILESEKPVIFKI